MRKENINKLMGNVVEKLIKMEVTEKSALEKCELYNEVWEATYNSFYSIVLSRYSASMSNINELTGFDEHDYAMDLTISLLVGKKSDRFNSFMRMVSACYEDNKTFNYVRYFNNMLTHYICDLLYPYALKEKVSYKGADGKMHHRSLPVQITDENGDSKRLYIKSISTSTSISDEDESLTLEDTLKSNCATPEEIYINDEEYETKNRDSSNRLSEVLKLVTNKHKNKLCLLALVNIINDNEDSMRQKIFYTTKKSLEGIVELHNHEVDKLINKGISVDESFYASRIDEFTLGDYGDIKSISAAYGRARDTAKKDLSKYYGIEFERQIHKKRK